MPLGRALRSEDESAFVFLLPEAGVDMERIERDFVVQALGRTRGNQSAAAKLLGLSRFQLRTRVDRFELKSR